VDPTRCIIRYHGPAGHGDIRLGFWVIKLFGRKRFLDAFDIPPGHRGSPPATAVIEWRRPTSLRCCGEVPLLDSAASVALVDCQGAGGVLPDA